MKTLIIDIGNSFVKATVFQGDVIIAHAHFKHEDTADLQYFVNNSQAERGAFAPVGAISPEIRRILDNALFPIKELQVRDIPNSLLCNKYTTPDTLGIDRIAAIIGAMTQSPNADILVIDIGTCVTYDLLATPNDGSREYLGGNISPGIDMRLKALHHFTAKLPLVKTEGQTPLIGVSTETAIRSGVINGIACEIDGFISQFMSIFPHLKVYLTGGGAKLLRISNKNHTFADDFLVEKGIFTILKAII